MKKKYALKKINERLEHLESEVKSLNDVVNNHDDKNFRNNLNGLKELKPISTLMSPLKSYKMLFFAFIYPLRASILMCKWKYPVLILEHRF